MKYFTAALILFSSLLFISSCSNTDGFNDLKEYGYKGKVRELTTKMYFDLKETDGKLEYDDSKVANIRTMYFDENGNLTKMTNKYPDDPAGNETIYYQFEDNRKSGFYAIDANKDTVQSAKFTWKNDYEYSYTSDFFTGRVMKSWSKLNEDFRDVAGGYTFKSKDSIYYSNSYENTVIEDNLIKETLSTNELTGEQNKWVLKYSDFDSEGNPQRVDTYDGLSNEAKNVAVREFKYY